MTLIDQLLFGRMYGRFSRAVITAHLDRLASEACASGDLLFALDATRASRQLKNLTASQPAVSTVRDSVRAEI